MTRTALITGGQQGIGLGIARALSGAGWSIAIASERPEDDPAVRAALAELGPDTIYLRHDLSGTDGCPEIVSEIAERLGPITTYVSNAGVPARVRGDMLDILPQNFDATLAVNLRGAFFLAQAVARHMLEAEVQGGPYRSISFVTSVSAEMVSIERAEYCISKSGASMMARLFALRLAPAGIGVFELRPGIIDTPMTAGIRDRYTARIEDGLVPARRWGVPSDVGDAILPLAEGRLAFATGTVVPIDGGLSIPRF